MTSQSKREYSANNLSFILIGPEQHRHCKTFMSKWIKTKTNHLLSICLLGALGAHPSFHRAKRRASPVQLDRANMLSNSDLTMWKLQQKLRLITTDNIFPILCCANCSLIFFVAKWQQWNLVQSPAVCGCVVWDSPHHISVVRSVFLKLRLSSYQLKANWPVLYTVYHNKCLALQFSGYFSLYPGLVGWL